MWGRHGWAVLGTGTGDGPRSRSQGGGTVGPAAKNAEDIPEVGTAGASAPARAGAVPSVVTS